MYIPRGAFVVYIQLAQQIRSRNQDSVEEYPSIYDDQGLDLRDEEKRGRWQGFCFRRTRSGRILPYICWKGCKFFYTAAAIRCILTVFLFIFIVVQRNRSAARDCGRNLKNNNNINTKSTLLSVKTRIIRAGGLSRPEVADPYEV